MKEELQALIQMPGAEKVRTAVEELLEPNVRQVKVDPLVIRVGDELPALVDSFFTQAKELREGARALFEASGNGLPAEYVPILSPEKLAGTLDQLEAAGYAVEEAGNKKEAIYANKPDLVKKKRDLEGIIKALEAEAIMQIQYDGRDAFVMIGDQKQKLGNDTARDAYRRTATKTQREELARVEGDIYKIDVELLPANDNWQKAVESSAIVKAKAGIQAALLNFLAARG